MKALGLFIMGVITLISAGADAKSQVPKAYQQTVFEITNHTNHIEMLNLFGAAGVWEAPWAVKSSILLKPNAVYKNRLHSIKKNGYLENYTSITVSSINDPKHHYLIFGTSNFSEYQEIYGDIFDGLGKMFVASTTNECKERTADGYTFCKLGIYD